MLVLSRKAGEKVVIGGDIVVTVIEVRRDCIRLGVEAPRAVPVHREEVWQAIQRANDGSKTPTEGTGDAEG